MKDSYRGGKVFVILFYDFGEGRVAKALKICRKYLRWVQNSVFEGELTKSQLKKLIHEIEKIMDKEYDSIIIYTFASMRYSERISLGIEKNKYSIFL